jgi:hypothetical protein
VHADSPPLGDGVVDVYETLRRAAVFDGESRSLTAQSGDAAVCVKWKCPQVHKSKGPNDPSNAANRRMAGTGSV